MFFLAYAALPMTLLMFSSVMSYILLLLLMVTATLVFISTYCGESNTLLLLVIMTVYIGAMITLFVYVGAVSPNDYAQPDSQFGNALALVSISLLAWAFTMGSAPFTSVSSLNAKVSSEMFSGHGVYLTGFLTLILLLMLLVSTYSTPSLSMFRTLK